MGNWENISLYQFQEIERINNNPKLDDWQRTCFTTCVVFGLTEYQLDNMEPKKANKLISRVNKIFSSEFKLKAVKSIGKYFIEYDPSKLSFGQYVELMYFLQGSPREASKPIIKNAHFILASITHTRFKKNDPSEHKRKADYFLSFPITETIGSVSEFARLLESFNSGYKTLFGLQKAQQEVEHDPFNRVFGWQYSAREVAKDEGITLDQAYKLPIRQALNSLTYLKAKAEYEEREMNNSKAKTNAR